jgi:hypothetical protein
MFVRSGRFGPRMSLGINLIIPKYPDEESIKVVIEDLDLKFEHGA